MFGVLYFGALLAYLLASLLIASLVAWIARIVGSSGWAWGLPAFVLMLGLVFWDWIPMEVMFSYDCNKYAGFTRYKSLDEWKEENPGVAETLIPIDNITPITINDREQYQLNQRFAWEITHKSHWFHIREREERIVDTKTGEILARYIDFDTDIPPAASGTRRPGAYKLWMMKPSCETNYLPQQIIFNGFHQSVKLLGSN